jgi:hypothetical protein
LQFPSHITLQPKEFCGAFGSTPEYTASPFGSH